MEGTRAATWSPAGHLPAAGSAWAAQDGGAACWGTCCQGCGPTSEAVGAEPRARGGKAWWVLIPVLRGEVPLFHPGGSGRLSGLPGGARQSQARHVPAACCVAQHHMLSRVVRALHCIPC